jgi:hypothetical protein
VTGIHDLELTLRLVVDGQDHPMYGFYSGSPVHKSVRRDGALLDDRGTQLRSLVTEVA